MNRETKTFTTPIGKQTVEIKTYLTGREKRDITNVYLNSGIQINKDTSDIQGINGDVVNKTQDIAFEVVVVSIDGAKENIVNSILDMREEDFNTVVAEVNKVTASSDFQEKKTI